MPVPYEIPGVEPPYITETKKRLAKIKPSKYIPPTPPELPEPAYYKPSPSWTSPTTDWLGGATAPPTPHWLPQFAPGETAWEPMKGFPAKVASGQLWGKTPWSHKMGLQAYINRYAGTVPGMIAAFEDYLDAIMGMQVRRAPSRAGRWMPARRR